MAITYPLAIPNTIGIESIELRAVNSVATSQSPYTYKAPQTRLCSRAAAPLKIRPQSLAMLARAVWATPPTPVAAALVAA